MPAMSEHIRSVDLLIHECNFRDGQEEWAENRPQLDDTVARVAATAGVKKMILVHFNSLDESDDPVDLAVAHRIFPSVEIGYDGMAIEF